MRVPGGEEEKGRREGRGGEEERSSGSAQPIPA
jgi:hypothetical protein